jgi:uncharacterized protein YndB with AHSA1/START domain
MNKGIDQGTGTVVVERSYNAPIEKVWDALTSPGAIRQWLFEVSDFKAVVGFEFQFTVEHEGETYVHLCRVTKVEPNQCLAYTWRYKGHEGESLVTFELSRDFGKTRLRLTHSGLDTFPKLPAFAPTNFLMGWTDLAGRSLKEFVEGANQVNDSNQEFSSDREIVISRIFNAPRELVWEAMTDPRHVVNWWGPRGFSTTIETMEVRPGGVWKHVMHGPDGANYPNKSIFKEVVKPERIVYSHGGGREDGPGASFVATWTFEELGEKKTKLTIRMAFPTPEARDFVTKEFGAIEGGKQTLERLGEHLATTSSEPFIISREFNASLDVMWKAWTERDQLLRWFGPKGFTMTQASLDFRPGGVFHYCMKTPAGQEIWGKFVYREISAPRKLVWVNSFSDKDGGVTRHPFSSAPWPLQMLTEVTFAEAAGKTTVTIRWHPLDATDEERNTFDEARPSMTQGWTGTFERLGEFLEGRSA